MHGSLIRSRSINPGIGKLRNSLIRSLQRVNTHIYATYACSTTRDREIATHRSAHPRRHLRNQKYTRGSARRIDGKGAESSGTYYSGFMSNRARRWDRRPSPGLLAPSPPAVSTSGSGDRAGAGREVVRRGWGRGNFEAGGTACHHILAGERAFRAVVKLRSCPCTRVV